ncbi:EAL domain-containing protein [Imhoffiella purpurea]|nr:EAL domain-containing protein [Imhoffiella purpurea]
MSDERIRRRAMEVLREGRFKLADDLLARSDLDLVSLVENLRVYQAELEIQNEELLRNQRQIQESLARFASLFNTLPVAELVIDHKGLVLEANPEAQALFGLSKAHLNQHFLARLIEEVDRGAVVGAWTKLSVDENLRLPEIRFRRLGDGGFIGDLHIAPLASPLGEIRQYVCAVLDRSEAVAQRRSLYESSERLRRSDSVLRERLKELAALHDVLAETARHEASVGEVLQHVVERLPDAWRFPDLAEARIQVAGSGYQTAGFVRSDWRQSVELKLSDGRAGEIQVVYRERPPVVEEDEPFLAEEGRLLKAVAAHVTSFLGRRCDEERLRETRERYRVLAEFSSEWEYWLGPEGRYLYVSPACERITGHSAAEFEADPELLTRLIHPEDRARWIAHAEHQRRDDECELDGLEFRLLTRDGRERWIEHICNQVIADDGRFLGRRGVNRDISERIEAERSLRLAARVFESTDEGVVITDPRARILAVNRAFTEITGYAEEEALGETPGLLRSGRQDSGFYSGMWDSLANRGHWRGELWNRHKEGHLFPVLLTVSSVLDDAGELTNYVGVFSDISHIKRAEERLEFLANHDPLTELPNRSMFQERLQQCIQRAERYKRQFALLFLDLDHFKDVNDTLGHPFGDALLKQVAEILAQQVRVVDTIARLGGDEFVVILEDIPEPRFAARFADRLMDVFAQPMIVVEQELFITVSIGISVYPQDGQDMDSLVRHADIAMYQAKSAGRNAFRFFEPLMSDGLARRMRLEHQLRGALERNEFVLHYQPQLSLDGRRLRGVETFCRWMHPELGLLPPERFLPMTEELGLIKELGCWVLEQSCGQLASWDRAGIRVPRLAVNLSMRELSGRETVARVREILERYRIAPERLELEVAESKLMRCADALVGNLKGIRELGVRLAVDDFGIGFSSMTLLQRLPLKRLKIDRSIVAALAADSDQRLVVRAIVSLAYSLGLSVLAEGIETREQADLLIGEGCEEGQGFFFCEPLPPGDLVWSWPA